MTIQTTGEYVVNSETEGTQLGGRTEILADGGWVTTYLSETYDDITGDYTTQILQQAYDANGAPVGGETLLGEVSNGYIDFAVVPSPDGGWTVYWLEETVYDADNSALKVQSFNADGSAKGSATTIAGGDADVSSFDIFVDDTGVSLGWIEGDFDSDTHTRPAVVMTQRFDENGAQVGDPQQVTPDGESFDGIAGPLSFWFYELETGQLGLNWSYYADSDEAGGVALIDRSSGEATPLAVDHDQLSFSGLVPLPNGNLVWVGFYASYSASASTQTIVQQLFSPDGTPIGDPVEGDPLTSDYSSGPDSYVNAFSIIPKAGGGWTTLWAITAFDTADEPTTTTHAQIFDATGTPLGDPVETQTLEGIDVYGEFLPTSDGGFIFVYIAEGYEDETDAFGTSLFVQKLDAEGTPVGDPILIEGGPDLEVYGEIYPKENGGFAIAYTTDMFDEDGFHIGSMLVKQSLTPSGALDGPPEVIAGGVGLDADTENALFLPDGKLAMLFSVTTHDDDGFAETTTLHYQVFDENFEPLRDETEIDAAPGYFYGTFQVNDSGQIAVLWESYPYDEDAAPTAAFQVFEPDGTPVSEAATFTPDIDGDPGRASFYLTSILPLDDGGWLVTFAVEEYVTVGDPEYDEYYDVYETTTYQQAFAADGTPLGDPIEILAPDDHWHDDLTDVDALPGGGWLNTKNGPELGDDEDDYSDIYSQIFTPANIAPTSADVTVDLAEGESHSFGLGDFGFADIDRDNLAAVIIVSLPALGTLALNGEPVSVGDEIAVDDLENLVFTPADGAPQTEGYTSFEVRVRDDGGTEGAGQDTSDTPSTVTIDIVATTFTGTDNADEITANDAANVISALDGDDIVMPKGGADDIRLGAGEDIVKGPLDALFGDVVQDFSTEDAIQVEGREILRSDITVELGSAILNIDADGDGTADGAITLEGDFTGGDFMAVFDGTDSWITFETFLPELAEMVAVDAAEINGVNNQLFLTGDGATGFAVTLDLEISDALFENALGVYEIDADGNLIDVTLLFANTKADVTDPALITTVGDGHELGFFLVQKGAAWAEDMTAGDTLSFVNGAGEAANLSDGSDLVLMLNDGVIDDLVFHSFDAAMNPAGLTRVVSGVEEGGEAITLGFEDRTGGGDLDYQDVVFTVEQFDGFLS